MRHLLAESSAFYVSYGALWVLVLGLAFLVLLVYRHFGMAALGTLEGVQRDGLPIGEEARGITGVDASGAPFIWTADRETLLLFGAPECQPCAEVMPEVNRLAAIAPQLDLAVLTVVAGVGESASRMKEKYSLRFPVVADDGSGAFEDYRVRVTPFAFVVGEDGRVRAKGLCNSGFRLQELLAAGGMDAAAQALAPDPASNGIASVVEVGAA